MAKRVKKKISEMSRGELRKLRYRDGLWLQGRKRIYLYWFKFLQHAERDERFTVDWSKYEGWGGADEVLNSKFDDWWDSHWKELFGMTSEGGSAKFNLSSSKIKADGVRFALIVYENRHRGSAKSIVNYLLQNEKRAGFLLTLCEGNIENTSSVISRYKREAGKILTNVCDGRFT